MVSQNLQYQKEISFWCSIVLISHEVNIVSVVRAETKNAPRHNNIFQTVPCHSNDFSLITLKPNVNLIGSSKSICCLLDSKNPCSVATLLTPTPHNISVGPAVCLTAMYTLPVLLSTAPSLYSAHNQYQTHNLCSVATLLTPTTQQYICRTGSVFNSNVHPFISGHGPLCMYSKFKNSK